MSVDLGTRVEPEAYGGGEAATGSDPETAFADEPELTPEEMREFVSYMRGRCRELLRIVAKTAAGDFSQKPEIVERDDELSHFIIGFRFMLEDLERAQAEQEHRRAALEAANRRLEELNRLRTQFINNAAHELNTPLTPLRTELYMLRLTLKDTSVDLEPLKMMERNVDRLTRLVGDLLEAARLQSSQVRLQKTRLDVGRVVEDSVASFRRAAEEGGVHLESHVTEGLCVDGDGGRLAQVLFNLVSNAIKFTPPGGTVRVEAAAEAGGLVIHVQDTGRGLTPDQRARLFQAFSQVHEPGEGPRGNGLGLYISKGIVEAHGGTIACRSGGPGAGTTFSVFLPAPEA